MAHMGPILTDAEVEQLLGEFFMDARQGCRGGKIFAQAKAYSTRSLDLAGQLEAHHHHHRTWQTRDGLLIFHK